jgi:ectoine hydroxylase-related dioxygenase (phytanoyl-CoA dioxygenase family)
VSAAGPADRPGAGIDRTVALDPQAIRSFRDKGHTLVRGLANDAELARCRAAIDAGVARRAQRAGPIEARDTYGRAFLQAPNLWTRNPAIRDFVFSARFARAAADLMGVDGVRLYHDQALFKEPGGGYTPWHQDQTYWPLDTDDTVTMWMPLVDVPANIGTMTFANASHRHGDLGRLTIGDESETAFAAIVERLGLATETHGALKAGDATFHRGWTLHRAPPNPTSVMRAVMTIIWFADGARVSADLSGARAFDHKIWLDGALPGALAAGPLNPLLWPR